MPNRVSSRQDCTLFGSTSCPRRRTCGFECFAASTSLNSSKTYLLNNEWQQQKHNNGAVKQHTHTEWVQWPSAQRGCPVCDIDSARWLIPWWSCPPHSFPRFDRCDRRWRHVFSSWSPPRRQSTRNNTDRRAQHPQSTKETRLRQQRYCRCHRLAQLKLWLESDENLEKRIIFFLWKKKKIPAFFDKLKPEEEVNVVGTDNGDPILVVVNSDIVFNFFLQWKRIFNLNKPCGGVEGSAMVDGAGLPVDPLVCFVVTVGTSVGCLVDGVDFDGAVEVAPQNRITSLRQRRLIMCPA